MHPIVSKIMFFGKGKKKTEQQQNKAKKKNSCVDIYLNSHTFSIIMIDNLIQNHVCGNKHVMSWRVQRMNYYFAISLRVQNGGPLEVSEEAKIVMLASTVISPKCMKKLPLKRTPPKISTHQQKKQLS